MSLAPAVTKDGFSFAGDLYAEASGHNRHRRATVSELKEHFKSGSDKDHPAHWFEAQLIHYGLQSSKTKSVARMRLYDAVNNGKLTVPSHIQKLEKDLKKEWTKSEREAKMAAKAGKGSSTASTTAASKKRKADSSNVDMNINIGDISITLSANNASKSSSAAKKTKTSATKSASNKGVKDTPTKSKPAPKPAKEAPKPKASAASKAKPTASSPAKPVKKQTARRGGISQGPSRGSTSTAEAATTAPYPAKQTARRGGNWARRGRISSSSAFESHKDFDEPPPPYQEYDDNDDSDDDDDSPPPSSSLGSLGLLNGRYDIFSREVNDQWGHEDFDLVLTLSGNKLWGKFDLGIVTGILHFDERPWESSDEPVPFTWRGEETDGPVWYGNNNKGWIRFLGNGRIEGQLDYMSLDFDGTRVSGQNTRSPIDAQSMQYEWNGYSEQEYDRQNRARWG
ncbi:hypothetical protein F5B22DRAFT_60876 [Xylaria bambusicola]|uniref:uncharacterized protein n=1 Tax=Xylaria bambusicola TaxID=326684 RepID=UPI00200859E0|nr:uncharacterized protein F5B22DRAFT_60876 [Xylaria bambusicola]KAI0518410.1 hypothetical protein F5B22DRAFT_60876 [Xylaria bambusicola]